MFGLTSSGTTSSRVGTRLLLETVIVSGLLDCRAKLRRAHTPFDLDSRVDKSRVIQQRHVFSALRHYSRPVMTLHVGEVGCVGLLTGSHPIPCRKRDGR